MTIVVMARKKNYYKATALLSLVFLVWIFFSSRNENSLILNEASEISDFDEEDEGVTSVRWNAEMEALLKQDEAKQVPGLGENGEPVTLTGIEAIKANEVMKKEAFNLILSDKISYNRSIIDARHPNCKRIKYRKDLPSASVIIIFTNERWSSLIRTIHSVLNRTPKRLLKEIVLVDDASDHEELKEKLDYYLATRLPKKVRLFRLPKRSGLIRARLYGAEHAVGDILVFLDAHCEVGIQWLEPLAQRIKDHREAVVVPIIDVIDDNTFEYQNNGGSFDFEVGGFTWSGHFTWIPVTDQEKRRRGSPEAPTRSPTMAGGLFAMDRKYFWEIGSYDRDMDVWGGENLEMSFRIWQCGGVLETLPCSRVGHIFRSFHPYTFPGNKDTHGINTARTVRVWMDDYKRLFFKHRPELEDADIGDLSERMELRKKLQCKNFKWYLDNIYKTKFILDENVQAYGRAMTSSNQLCLDNLQNSEEEKYTLGVYACHGELFMSQFFSLSNEGELRREFLCAEASSTTNQVQMFKCHGGRNQKWEYLQNGALRHVETGLCMDTQGLGSMASVLAVRCNNSRGQKWTWDFIPKER